MRKTRNCFEENCRKSQKIEIITLTPWRKFQNPFYVRVCLFTRKMGLVLLLSSDHLVSRPKQTKCVFFVAIFRTGRRHKIAGPGILFHVGSITPTITGFDNFEGYPTLIQNLDLPCQTLSLIC
jgi:hypothetical protein